MVSLFFDILERGPNWFFAPLYGKMFKMFGFTAIFKDNVIVRTLKLKKGLFFEFNAPTIRKDEFSIL